MHVRSIEIEAIVEAYVGTVVGLDVEQMIMSTFTLRKQNSPIINKVVRAITQ